MNGVMTTRHLGIYGADRFYGLHEAGLAVDRTHHDGRLEVFPVSARLLYLAIPHGYPFEIFLWLSF
jgi:hypothetical protein